MNNTQIKMEKFMRSKSFYMTPDINDPHYIDSAVLYVIHLAHLVIDLKSHRV